MPQKRPAPYDSDGGAVVPDDYSENETGRKRVRASAAKKNGVVKGDKSRTGAKGGKSAKKGGGGGDVPGGGERDAKGEAFWEISDKRRVTISQFSGKQMINVREYYEKDGEYLPGKKGISLPIPQFNALVALLPHLEAVLAEKGETLSRPEYGGPVADAGGGGDDDDDDGLEERGGEGDGEEDEEDEEVLGKGRKGREKGERVGKGRVGGSGKKNFEETSEDE